MHKKIEMVDLSTQYQRLKSEIDSALIDSVEACQYINGPQVKTFSKNLADYLSVSEVVPCANGTDALQLALMSLALQPGDEVITPAFSFVASAEVIALLGYKPVFVDVDSSTYNVSVPAIEAAITPKTRAILPVHLFGQGADMELIIQLADKHGLFVIEDVAQSLGASCQFNSKQRKLGTMGHIGCTSFFPSKNLGGFGDGGACFTNNPGLAEKMKMIAGHGSKNRYYHEVVGVNSRLDTLQAAVLDVKLKYLDDFLEARRKAAHFYNSALGQMDGMKIPAVSHGNEHTYNQYTIRVVDGKRDQLKAYLEERDIPSRIYYPLPLHHQKAFSPYVVNGFQLPVSDQLSNEVLSLPIHTEMDSNQLQQITGAVTDFFK